MFGSLTGGGKARRGVALLALGAALMVGGCKRVESAPGEAAQAGSSAELPRLGTVPPFWLTDQEGRRFSEQTLQGKVWVGAFMFTRCPTVCPLMVSRMRALQAQAKEREVRLNLVSFSVDPENDTPEVLRRYTAQQGLDTASWWFVTGDSAVIRKTAEDGFKIGVSGSADPNAPHYGITHGTHLVLIDAERTIRGYYQSSEPERVEQLLKDAARLASES